MVRAASGSRSGFCVVVGTVLVALSTTCIGRCEHPLGKRNFKQQIESLEEQWRTAQLSGDVATMDRLLSDDYMGISMTGQVNTKSQQLDHIRRHLFQLTRMDLADVKIRLLGQVAIVTSLASVDGMNNGAPVSGNFRYTRIYHHLPLGGWKITNFEATRIPGRTGPKAVATASEDHPG